MHLTGAGTGIGTVPLHRTAANQPRSAACKLLQSAASDSAPQTSSESLYDTLHSWITHSLQIEERRHASLQKEAKEAKRSESLGRWATLIVSNLYRIDQNAKRVVVEDWEDNGKKVELQLDPTKGTAQEQADAAFAKARKLRRGSAVVQELQLQSRQSTAALLAWQEELTMHEHDVTELQRLQAEMLKAAKSMKLKTDRLASTTAQQASEKKQNQRAGQRVAPKRVRGKQVWTGRTLESPSGIPILVGRNRRENELLSLVIARHPDVWMHVRESPGAHVVLRVSQAGARVPTDECMQMAANLAAYYSDLRTERKAIVSYTSPKHITKPARAPLGAVRIRKEEGTWLGQPDGVPEELKLARERFENRAD